MSRLFLSYNIQKNQTFIYIQFSFFLLSFGLLRRSATQDAFYLTNLPRHVGAEEVQAYSPYSSVFWFGDVCQGVLNQTCLDSQTNLLSPGIYRLRFSALKHFGNATNPADFEVYRTPPFELVY